MKEAYFSENSAFFHFIEVDFTALFERRVLGKQALFDALY